MKPGGHHLERLFFNGLTLLSLLLALAACGLWVRSITTTDTWYLQSRMGTQSVAIGSVGGYIRTGWRDSSPIPPPMPGDHIAQAGPPIPWVPLFTIKPGLFHPELYSPDLPPYAASSAEYYFADWLFMLPFAAIWLGRWNWRRRLFAGVLGISCLGCAFDNFAWLMIHAHDGAMTLRPLAELYRDSDFVARLVVFLALVCGAISFSYLVFRRSAKTPMTICRSCGYDLRGSPGPTCPECGEPIANAVAPMGLQEKK